MQVTIKDKKKNKLEELNNHDKRPLRRERRANKAMERKGDFQTKQRNIAVNIMQGKELKRERIAKKAQENREKSAKRRELKKNKYEKNR